MLKFSMLTLSLNAQILKAQILNAQIESPFVPQVVLLLESRVIQSQKHSV